jgi:CheY-like chemotaxis protein
MMSEPSSPTYTALVVDDNFYNRDIFKIALINAGFQVTETASGTEGLTILQKEVFDLLVLDLQMPDMDGREVLRSINEGQPGRKRMRTIVVTANAHMATDEVEDAADYIMYKPIDVMEFTRFVKRLVLSSTQV